MVIDGVKLNCNDVIDFDIGKHEILVRPRASYFKLVHRRNKNSLSIVVDKKGIFENALFWARKEVKKRKNPDDRLFDYECEHPDLIEQLNIRERLVESRKTNKEKREELLFEIWIKEETEKIGLEYYGPLRED